MKSVLVTGATGCVGSNLTHHLIQRGYSVRAFHRAGSNTATLDGLEADHRVGDTRDRNSLKHAIAGCDTVFHTAAIVAFWRKRHREQMEVNVNGTRNVVEACLELGVRKLVHTSSVAALGHRSDGRLIDETVEFNLERTPGYRYSKHLAECEVMRGVERGLDATIVNPSVVVGPRDPHFHGGQIVRDIARGRIPFYVEGGMNVVGAGDVAAGHLLAAERGRTGERYILGGQNLSYRQIFEITAAVLGSHPPRMRAPIFLLKGLARLLDVAGIFTSSQPMVTTELVATIGTHHWYSDEKARRELGYLPTPIEPAIQDAYRWYRENGLLSSHS